MSKGQAGDLSQNVIERALIAGVSELSSSIGESVPLDDYRDSLRAVFWVLGSRPGQNAPALFLSDIDR